MKALVAIRVCAVTATTLTNAPFDDRPARLELRTGCVVLIDPLALDGLRAELISLSAAKSSEQRTLVEALGRNGLRIGLEELPAFQPGVHQLDADSFASADAEDPHAGVFQIDSGSVVVIDLSTLAGVARSLTWERYDSLLRSPFGDDSRLFAINAEVGGPHFAIISGDVNRAFSGDGAFRLLPDRLIRLA